VISTSAPGKHIYRMPCFPRSFLVPHKSQTLPLFSSNTSSISHQCDHNLWNEGVSDCKAPSPLSSPHHSSTESDSSSLAFPLPPSLPPSLSLSSLLSLISLFQSRPNSKSFPGSGPVHLTPQPKWNREGERHIQQPKGSVERAENHQQ